jgi:hypothetical protein
MFLGNFTIVILISRKNNSRAHKKLQTYYYLGRFGVVMKFMLVFRNKKETFTGLSV